MAQIYGRRSSEKAAKPLTNSRMFQLFICIFLFAVAAVCKNLLPAGYREALVVGLDSGLSFRDVLSAFGESATSTEVFSRLWSEGVLKVFGFQEPTEDLDIPGSLDLVEDENAAKAFNPRTILDLNESTVIPVFAASDLAVDAGELPPYPDQTDPPDVPPEEADIESSSGEDEGENSSESKPAEPGTTTGNNPPDPDIVSREAVTFPFDYVTPVLGTFTSGFGYREHPIDGAYKFHYGVDIAAAAGTDVNAFADGKVIFTGWGDINGYYIKVEHDDGFVTLYAHLDKILVKNGASVKAGSAIGLVGSTGEVSGPHLHFQIYKDAKLIDPLPFLDFAA